MNAKEARNLNHLTQRGIVQKLSIPGGILLDQDGNKYPDALTKYNFLKSCLTDGIRSGNLQPITTINQAQDLISRINKAAAESGQKPITERNEQALLSLWKLREHHKEHEQRVRLFQKLERTMDPTNATIFQKCTGNGPHDHSATRHRMAWDLINSMTESDIAIASSPGE